MARNAETIMGHTIPAPKMTRRGYVLAFNYVVLPVLLALTAIDVLLYMLFRYAFNSCYGVLCFF